MTWPARQAVLWGLVILAGCAARIDHQPDVATLDGLSRDQREQIFVETLSRARKPRIVQVWIDDVSYGYDSDRTVRGGYGIPIGVVGHRRIIYFANIGRLQLFTNNAVFVYDTSGRIVDKVVFANRTDAARMVDVMGAYHAQRMDPADDDRYERGQRNDRDQPRRYDRRDDRRYDDRDYYDPRYDDRY